MKNSAPSVSGRGKNKEIFPVGFTPVQDVGGGLFKFN